MVRELPPLHRKENMEDTSDGRSKAFRGLAADLAELTIHVGLMGSVAPNWPEEVRQNWSERIEGMRKWAGEQILEIQHFAESFDDD